MDNKTIIITTAIIIIVITIITIVAIATAKLLLPKRGRRTVVEDEARARDQTQGAYPSPLLRDTPIDTTLQPHYGQTTRACLTMSLTLTL